MCVITPELLLQGGRLCAGPEHGEDLETEFRTVSQHMKCTEQAFLNWWRLWFDQVWESLVPYKKWRAEHRNVRTGDIVLLQYLNKVSTPSYRYGRVIEAHPDRHGVVRNATVGTKSRKGGDKPRKLELQMVPVQRLVMLLPVEEQENLEPADPHLHICEEDFRVPSKDLTAPLSSTIPAAPSAPAPQNQEYDPEATLPLDVDRTLARQINSFAVLHAGARHPGSYYCSPCETRANLRLERRPQPYGFSVTS